MPWSTNSRRRKLMGEINVVPYIDVMLVLLIIFMITAPLLARGHQGRPARRGCRAARSRTCLPSSQPLVLSVDAKGRLYQYRSRQGPTD